MVKRSEYEFSIRNGQGGVIRGWHKLGKKQVERVANGDDKVWIQGRSIGCSGLASWKWEKVGHHYYKNDGHPARGRASPGQRPCARYLSWPCERCFSRFGAGVTLPQPACRQPVAKLGGRLAGADVEEHWGRDEAYDLAAKRAAKNTLRAKLVQE